MTHRVRPIVAGILAVLLTSQLAIVAMAQGAQAQAGTVNGLNVTEVTYAATFPVGSGGSFIQVGAKSWNRMLNGSVHSSFVEVRRDEASVSLLLDSGMDAGKVTIVLDLRAKTIRSVNTFGSTMTVGKITQTASAPVAGVEVPTPEPAPVPTAVVEATVTLVQGPVADNPTTTKPLHVDPSPSRTPPDFTDPEVQKQWAGFMSFAEIPVVEPVKPPPGTRAWTSVPGVYEGFTYAQGSAKGSNSPGMLLITKAYQDMKSVRQVEPDMGRFMSQLSRDKRLKADFMPFLVTAAYHYLVQPAPGNSISQLLKTEIGVRSMDWQAYSAEKIRYQWDVFSNNKMRTGKYKRVGPDKWQAVTLSGLIDVPVGCGDFKPEPPLITTGAGAKGQHAVEYIYGNLQFFNTVKMYSEAQLDDGRPWSETLLGGFESTWGMNLSRQMGEDAAAQAFTKIGIGSATALPIIGGALGIDVYYKFQKEKFTLIENSDLKLKDLTATQDKKLLDKLDGVGGEPGKRVQWQNEFDQKYKVSDFADDAQFDLAKKKFVNGLVDQAKKENAKVIAGLASDAAKRTDEAAGKAIKKALGLVLERKADDVVVQITRKAGQKTFLKALSVGISVLGVIWDFGEIFTAALPCEVWEKQILARLQVVEPDFHQTLVAAKEYEAGVVYTTSCPVGYSGTGMTCMEDGCPYGYTESLRYCTAKVIPEKTHTRTAGKRGSCAAGEENSLGLCYSACPSFAPNGVGPVCWSNCSAGYNDTGAFCTKPAHVINQDNYSRATQATPLTCAPDQEQVAGLCYTKCPPGYDGDVTKCIKAGCPSDYDNDNGASCYRFWPPATYWKPTIDRGVGVAISSCPSGRERIGALCYPVCRSDYRSTALECDKACPAGYTDDGVTCRSNVDTIAKRSAGRSISIPLECNDPAYPSSSGLLCYPECEEGYVGDGPVCWQPCPAGLKDTGATCQYVPDDGVISIEKRTFNRGVGRPPRHAGGDYDGDGLIDSADPDSYNRVDHLVDSVTAETRNAFRLEVFMHLTKFLITEPADAGQLLLPQPQ